MAYRVPDNRPNDRVDKGEQPYTDDRETMSQKEAKLQDRAAGYEEHDEDPAEERRAKLETDAQESFKELQGEQSRRR